ncbi:MAG: RNA 2'-phosphotransferase [Akkermansiaceae bacterium]
MEISSATSTILRPPKFGKLAFLLYSFKPLRVNKYDIKISRTLSLVLRHNPGAIGLTLDDEGWADIDELLTCLAKQSKTIDLATLDKVVTENSKQRFSFSKDGQRIRANQGHSIDVDLKLTEKIPPKILYHGTASRFIEMIESEGLKSMTRQHVHLSPDIRTAHAVGQRHGIPVILEITADSMVKHGFKFYHSENGVWLTEKVPPDYLNRRFSF